MSVVHASAYAVISLQAPDSTGILDVPLPAEQVDVGPFPKNPVKKDTLL